MRTGYVTARDRDAFARWQRDDVVARRSGLVGASLEQAVMGLSLTHPEYVAFGPREVAPMG